MCITRGRGFDSSSLYARSDLLLLQFYSSIRGSDPAPHYPLEPASPGLVVRIDVFFVLHRLS